jgi:hypothetical protein
MRGWNAQVHVNRVSQRLPWAIEGRIPLLPEGAILERRGRGVAALVSMQDLALIEALEDGADVRTALEARKEKGQVPLSKIKPRLGIK